MEIHVGSLKRIFFKNKHEMLRDELYFLQFESKLRCEIPKQLKMTSLLISLIQVNFTTTILYTVKKL